MWKKHNSLTDTGIPIHVWLTMCPDEIVTNDELLCEDELFRRYEKELRLNIYQDFIQDDTIIEPFLYVRAKHVPDLNHRYGFPLITGSELDTRKYHFEPAVKTIEDIDKLVMPRSKNRLGPTNSKQICTDAIGDVLPVVVEPSPMFVANRAIFQRYRIPDRVPDLFITFTNEPEMLLSSRKPCRRYSEGARQPSGGVFEKRLRAQQCITYSIELRTIGFGRPGEEEQPCGASWLRRSSPPFLRICSRNFCCLIRSRYWSNSASSLTAAAKT
jgi:hypothetical protein